MSRFGALLWIVTALSACGGAPTGPSALPDAPSGAAPAGASTTLTFVSGETHQPITEASVVVDGRSYSVDASGRVALSSAPSASAALEAEAPGFLLRETLLRDDLFSLWPKVSPTGLDEEYTARLVYSCTGAPCASGGEPMIRVPQRAVVIVPSAAFLADADARESHEGAARLLTAAAEGAVTFTVAAARVSGAVIVETSVDPLDPDLVALHAAAVTRRTVDAGSAITRATVTVRSLELARRLPLMLHELGHTFGLAHSPRRGDVMWSGPELYSSTDFSAPEKLAIALMLQRTPGNRFPDHDPGLATQSMAPRVSVIACEGR
jgi:hypothetical protein